MAIFKTAPGVNDVQRGSPKIARSAQTGTDPVIRHTDLALFGSTARGETQGGSDIDVMVFALAEMLHENGWPYELAELVADAVGCHHGSRASPSTLDHLMGDWRAMGKDIWTEARRGLLEVLLEVFKPNKIPTKHKLCRWDGSLSLSRPLPC